jgi:hypothetical protein
MNTEIEQLENRMREIAMNETRVYNKEVSTGIPRDEYLRPYLTLTANIKALDKKIKATKDKDKLQELKAEREGYITERQPFEEYNSNIESAKDKRKSKIKTLAFVRPEPLFA